MAIDVKTKRMRVLVMISWLYLSNAPPTMIDLAIDGAGYDKCGSNAAT
jgi:hypothetical protein